MTREQLVDKFDECFGHTACFIADRIKFFDWVMAQFAQRPTQRALDLPSASAGCKCFVSIESYNNCPVHGTANQ